MNPPDNEEDEHRPAARRVTSKLFPVTIAILAASGAVALGLSTYTFSNHETAPYEGIRTLITESLQDPSDRPLPPIPAGLLPLEAPATPPEVENPQATEPIPLLAPEPRDWGRAAAARDSAALRSWLGAAVLATSVISGDTVYLTLRRLSLDPGCPWVSTLQGTFAGSARPPLHLVRVTASCPGNPA